MDSPFCNSCLKGGVLSNTYKLVRSNLYKCGTCHRYSEPKEYEAIDFEWRDKFSEWEKKARGTITKANQKVNVMELDRIKKVGQR